MGYREDVVIVYSSKGWKQLVSAINTLDKDDQILMKELISDHCDKSRVTDDDERLIGFDQIKTHVHDFKMFLSLHKQIDPSDYLYLSLGEDGDEQYEGGYFDNPFNIGVTRSIHYEYIGDDNVSKLFAAEIAQPKSCNINCNKSCSKKLIEAVNDHTCNGCGNTKCSKNEKSCWKCGAAL